MGEGHSLRGVGKELGGLKAFAVGVGRDQYELKEVKAAGPSAFMNVGSASE